MAIKWLSGKKIEYATGDTLPTINIEEGTEAKNISTGAESTFIGGIWVTDPGGEGGGVIEFVDLNDVDWTGAVSGDVPTWNGTELVPQEPPGASGGEANTTSNEGTGEGTLALAKVGINLPIKTLKQGSNITLTNNANDVTITSAYPPDASDSVKGVVELSLSNGTESAGGRAVQDNDPRLTNSRTPTAHNHAGTDITSGTVSADRLPNASESAKGVVELATSAETTAGLVVQASDSRLSDARTPIAHNHAGTDINSGTIPISRIQDASTTQKGVVELATSAETTAGLVVQASDTRLSDARTPTSHNHSWADITSGTPPKIDDLTQGDDNTDLNASTSRHGLFSKLSTTAFQVFRINSGGTGGEWASLDSERTGKAVGNGGATEYIIAHGLGSTPSYAFIDCSTHSTGRTWTVDNTNITVTFNSTLAGGTNAVNIYWRVIA